MLGIISFILVPKMHSKWPFKYSLLIGIGLVIFSFVTKILIQMYSLFMEKDLMAKAISDILDHKSKYEELSMGALNTVRNLPSQESINEEYNKFLEMIERKEL
mgnify:CR=1 FL=1